MLKKERTCRTSRNINLRRWFPRPRRSAVQEFRWSWRRRQGQREESSAALDTGPSRRANILVRRFLPHTPKLESAPRVKNMFFFFPSANSLRFSCRETEREKHREREKEGLGAAGGAKPSSQMDGCDLQQWGRVGVKIGRYESPGFAAWPARWWRSGFKK